MKAHVSRIVAAACVVLVALGLWWWHEAHESNKAMAASDEALASGDVTLAIERAREAAMHVTPSPSRQGGFERLASIADDAEARGDIATMKTALLAMRAAADSTDDATWRSRADDALPRCALREGASADVITPMKLELATPTHPPQTAHLAIALLALAMVAVAMRLTRTSRVAPQK